MIRRILSPGIIADPDILHGAPVIEGTRIPVYIVLGKLGAGMTMEEFYDNYDLTSEQVRAAVMYAASHLEEEAETIIRAS